MQLHCPKCKRPIPEPDEEVRVGISYCYGCEYYFPSSQKTTRNRKEIIVPHLASALRLRLEENSITITFRWFRNYRLITIIETLMKDEIQAGFSGLAYLLNKTKVFANQNQLTIEHKPIDLLPYTYFARSYVKQLYVQPLHSNISDFPSYGLWARVTQGDDVLLLYDLDKRILLFIEQEIERIFGIEDEEVSGEIVE